MRTRTPAAVTGIGLVIAVTIGVSASASFATQDLVSEQGDVITDDVKPMDDLRTRGSVKGIRPQGRERLFARLHRDVHAGTRRRGRAHRGRRACARSHDGPVDELPDAVGPAGVRGAGPAPFASQTLQLRVTMNGACFEPVGKDGGYRLQGFDPKCTEAWLSLGDESFNVSDLFIDVDSRLKAVGRDGQRWMWRATATFEDPGYGFPIVSLGQGGSTTVVVGDMGGVTSTGKVKFDSKNRSEPDRPHLRRPGDVLELSDDQGGEFGQPLADRRRCRAPSCRVSSGRGTSRCAC